MHKKSIRVHMQFSINLLWHIINPFYISFLWSCPTESSFYLFGELAVFSLFIIYEILFKI